jgi:hypothetical protein
MSVAAHIFHRNQLTVTYALYPRGASLEAEREALKRVSYPIAAS